MFSCIILTHYIAPLINNINTNTKFALLIVYGIVDSIVD